MYSKLFVLYFCSAVLTELNARLLLFKLEEKEKENTTGRIIFMTYNPIYNNLVFIMPILNFLDISSLGLRSYHLLFGIKFEEILSCTVSNESLQICVILKKIKFRCYSFFQKISVFDAPGDHILCYNMLTDNVL